MTIPSLLLAGLLGAPAGAATGSPGPVPASYRVLVILAQFDPDPGTTSQFTLTPSAVQAKMDAVRGLIQEESYGLVTASFNVTGVYPVAGMKSAYGSSDCRENSSCTGNNNVVSALLLGGFPPVPADYNVAAFDHIMVVTAGLGEETTNAAADFQSAFVPIQDSNSLTPCKNGQGVITGFEVSGKCFDGASFVPEREAAGFDVLGPIARVYMHELGAVDLFDTTSGTGTPVVGQWSLMDGGQWLGSPAGSNPAHLDAWTKVFLGWATPGVPPNAAVAASLSPAETTPVILKLPASGSDVGSSEYFLLEYRDKNSAAAYDKGLSASGLLVWHVDDSRGTPSLNDVNQGPRPRVRLMRASQNAGSTPNAPLSGTGDAGDPYPGSSSAASFAGVNWNGAPSLALAAGIAGAGSSAMTAVIERPFPLAPGAGGLFQYLNLTAQVQPGTFDAAAQILFSTPSSFPAPVSALGALQGSGVGMSLTALPGVQPKKPLALTMTYTDPQVSGLVKADLVIARYDPPSGLWVPLASSADLIARKVTATTDHLSLFQLMSFAPASTVDAAKAYPNPVLPSRGQQMTFARLPAGASVSLYTLTGQKVKGLTANATGLALWDVTNDAGAPVASGLYFALVDDGNGNRKTLKIMVER